MRSLILVVVLAIVFVGLISLKRQTSYNLAIKMIWTGKLPSISVAGGRGWVYAHNGSPQSIDEMALSMGDDIMKAHPGEFKKIEDGIEPPAKGVRVKYKYKNGDFGTGAGSMGGIVTND